ncbi:MAG TPA: FHA domain-containing protein [Solirubrobacteraceae bacterium]|nr:FHA domain-containing protein [Solirubrobacteraceae bacterium]
MSVVCPRGHQSEATDYCDQCGALIASGGTTQVLPALEEADTSPAARREPCPACGAARSGDDRYCESCGYDFLSPPQSPSPWEAIVTADRAQFERLAVAGVSFPADYPERRFVLADGENRIGRSRGHPDEPAPEIDLAAAPADPGVSRLHATLERRDDGAIVVRDLGSTNGTMLNDNPAPIAPREAIPLADGDRVHVGAWTTITVRKR